MFENYCKVGLGNHRLALYSCGWPASFFLGPPVLHYLGPLCFLLWGRPALFWASLIYPAELFCVASPSYSVGPPWLTAVFCVASLFYSVDPPCFIPWGAPVLKRGVPLLYSVGPPCLILWSHPALFVGLPSLFLELPSDLFRGPPCLILWRLPALSCGPLCLFCGASLSSSAWAVCFILRGHPVLNSWSSLAFVLWDSAVACYLGPPCVVLWGRRVLFWASLLYPVGSPAVFCVASLFHSVGLPCFILWGLPVLLCGASLLYFAALPALLHSLGYPFCGAPQ